MSKADDALTTSAKPTATRRSVLSQGAGLAGAAVVGYAGLLPIHALAAISQPMPPANDNELADLAESRQLIAALIANDTEISAAEEAGDTERAEAL
jgi:hypothetical protein